ncbi:glycyl-tRNA synthetase, beta subunit [Synechococcus sp. PCC 7335]|uniref:glycine--tRNA ligase subunit beta n=1 Tax=Synechococcus sp. (strain ATCC 29403 / PCC 7335) TaxID=91464 RepID=UPI00017EC79B|nr:glycine--tRNA ligase subunit beta [Synechococcus sp. PCC 7335]EDX85985.1 glycyl-tRNA synthetase, beta subunit [Synechococcus sp. PCC 7335]
MATFLLEVGTEELPASFVSEAIAQWKSKIPTDLSQQFIESGQIEFYATPRRLAVLIHELPERQPTREEEAKGPPAKAAYKGGKPTKAATGFAASKGVSVDQLEVRNTDKGEFVFVRQTIPGRQTAELLQAMVPEWVLGLEGSRFMRWGDGDLRFPRPIRSLVTLLDTQLIPVSLENGSEVCQSDRTTTGHRVLHPEKVSLDNAQDYVSALKSAYVTVDPLERKTIILDQVAEVASSVDGHAVINEDLLAEVVDLVEWPTAIIGKFDEEFLALPSKVTITEMESHQRYFPVRPSTDTDQLLPYFITVSNGDPAKSALITQGNERVIRARLADGKFFFDADQKQPFADYLPQLETVTFEAQLGSVREKVSRIEKVTSLLSDQLGLSPKQKQQAIRAAQLCKADLVTQMVGEFPELQGYIGQKYAANSGEPAAVADAIYEHYLPRGAGDSLPQTLIGQVVGIADRLDTLVSIFSIGKLPKGSSDPFALRRAANAVITIVWDADLPLKLYPVLTQVVEDFAASREGVDPDALMALLIDFFDQRIRTLLQDNLEIDYDLVNAIFGQDKHYQLRSLTDLLDVRDRATFLQSIRNDARLAVLYETVNRAAKLAVKGELDTDILDPEGIVDPTLFEQPSEQAFYDSLQTLLPQTQAAQAERDYSKLITGLEQAAPTVANFFDGDTSVMVMAEETAVRQNRLNLLGLLRNHARVLADFGEIVKS